MATSQHSCTRAILMIDAILAACLSLGFPLKYFSFKCHPSLHGYVMLAEWILYFSTLPFAIANLYAHIPLPCAGVEIHFPCLNTTAKINSWMWVISGDGTNRPKANSLGSLNLPCSVLQFRDRFAIPFLIKYDRCSLDAQTALTSISLQWTSVTLEIQYYLNEWGLVLLESFKQCKMFTGSQDTLQHWKHLGGAC